MNNSLLISDTHLGIYDASDFWHDVCLNLFKAIADFCNRNNIERIIHLGDFFHKKKSINVKSLNYAIDYIAPILNEFETIIVVGNHDCFYQNRIHPHSLVIFKKYKNIRVIDEPTSVRLENRDIGFIPWKSLPVLGVDVLMGHFEINDFKMNEGYTMKKGTNPMEFGMYKQVISGHFHTPMERYNIKYLGAPFQQNFADVGGERGFYLYTENKIDFIAYTDAPQFLKIIATKEMSNNPNHELLNNIKDNIIKLIFEEDFGTQTNNMILESVMFNKPFRLETDFGRISAKLTDEKLPDTVEMADNKEIVRDYIMKSELPENLDKKTVIDMMLSLARGE